MELFIMILDYFNFEVILSYLKMYEKILIAKFDMSNRGFLAIVPKFVWKFNTKL